MLCYFTQSHLSLVFMQVIYPGSIRINGNVGLWEGNRTREPGKKALVARYQARIKPEPHGESHGVLTTASFLPISPHSNDPGQGPNADSSIKCTSHHHSVCFTNQFQDQHVTRNLKSENKWKKVICAYPWVPSVQPLLWLVQVLFSHPLTFAFALIHPEKTKEIFIKPVRTSLESSSVMECSYN